MSFIKDHLPASIASQIFEDEPKPAAHTQAPVPPAPQFSQASVSVQTNVGYQIPPPMIVGALPLESADHTDDAYQKLLAKTDFTQTPVFQSLNKYLAPLVNSGLDDKMKFGIALKQAQAIDHLDPASVLAIFDQFKDTLTNMANNFAQAVANKTHIEVDTKNAKAAELQAQAKQFTEDAFNAQQSIQQSQHRFDVALKARQDEITQEQAKYASFLA
jgi:hypothetical protein